MRTAGTLVHIVRAGRRVLQHTRRNVVAYAALFFALGGIAAAAAQPLLDRPGSVERSNIEAGAVGMKKLAPNVRGEIDVPVPEDGLYAGNGVRTSVEARVLAGQITEMGVLGACEWPMSGGAYDSNGGSWSYVSVSGTSNSSMQAFGEIVDERTLVVDQLLTGDDSRSGASQECDQITLTLQSGG